MPKNTKPRRRYPPEILRPEDIAALFEACGEGTWMATRNRALLAVLHRSGLRIAEALALAPKDINVDAGSIRVLHAKGGRARTVGIDPTGRRPLAAWLDLRERLGIPPAAPVFVGPGGRPLTAAYCRRLLAGLGRRAGVLRRVHPHGLRHTHAAELREEGVDIGIISKQLGHRSIATTASYLDHIAPRAVVEIIGRRRG
jgi:integrase